MRKTIALLLILIFVYPCTYAAEYTDSEGLDFAEEYRVLCSLGLFADNGSYKPDVFCTRGEFVKAIINSYPKEMIPEYSDDTEFPDVSADDNYAYIAFAAGKLGIVKNDVFDSGRDISLTEACVMVLRTLGYDDAAETSGGFPTGYLTLAARTGLLKNVKSDADNRLKFSDAVKILYNMLDTNILEVTYMSENEKRYEEGGTYSEEIMKVFCGQGIIFANQFVSMYGCEKTVENSINIGGVLLNGSTAVECGTSVKYWAKKKKGEENPTLLTVIKQNELNRVLKIDAELINEYSNLKYTYYPDENESKRATARISPSAEIIYNGEKPERKFSYVPDDGEVYLIDNNKDGEYDVVYIYNYSMVWVKAVIREEYKVFNNYAVPYELSLDSGKYNVIYKDGKSFKDIVPNSVILAACSQSGESVAVKISNNTAEGTPTAIGRDYAVIGGKEYKVYKGCETLNPDEYGVFYLDAQSRIAGFEKKTENAFTTGILTKACVSEKGFSETLMIKVFTEDKKMMLLEAEERIKVGEKIYRNMNDVLSVIKDGDTELCKLIRYKTDSAGKLIEIQIPKKYSQELDNDNDVLRELYYPKTYLKSVGVYFSNIFCRRVGSTKIFTLPKDLDDESCYDFRIDDGNYFRWTGSYTLSAYSLTPKCSYAEYIVVHNDGEAVSQCGIVTGKSDVVTEDKEEGTALELYTDIGEVSYNLRDNVDVVNIKNGDIVQFTLNSNNEIRECDKLFDAETMSVIGGNPSAPVDAGLRCYFGNVYSGQNGTMQVTTLQPAQVTSRADYENVFAGEGAKVISYDKKRNIVSLASPLDIKDYVSFGNDYSKIFTVSGDSIVKLVIIYD